MNRDDLANLIRSTIQDGARTCGAVTPYREPIIGFVPANAPGFLDLADDVQVCGKCAVAGPCALALAVGS